MQPASRFRLRSFATLPAALVVFLLTSGCDRGDRPGQLGQMAPAITVDDDHTRFDLEAQRGHVVLVNFWASWCGPCIAEMPALAQLQQDVPEIKIVGIAFDEDAAAYQTYLARRPVPFFTVLDTTGAAHTRFGTFRPPESYIIDKSGQIRQKFIGTQDWTSPEIEGTLRKLARG